MHKVYDLLEEPRRHDVIKQQQLKVITFCDEWHELESNTWQKW